MTRGETYWKKSYMFYDRYDAYSVSKNFLNLCFPFGASATKQHLVLIVVCLDSCRIPSSAMILYSYDILILDLFESNEPQDISMRDQDLICGTNSQQLPSVQRSLIKDIILQIQKLGNSLYHFQPSLLSSLL